MDRSLSTRRKRGDEVPSLQLTTTMGGGPRSSSTPWTSWLISSFVIRHRSFCGSIFGGKKFKIEPSIWREEIGNTQ
jgi:hypothetical protein